MCSRIMKSIRFAHLDGGTHRCLHIRSQTGTRGPPGHSRGGAPSGRQVSHDSGWANARHQRPIDVSHRLEGMARYVSTHLFCPRSPSRRITPPLFHREYRRNVGAQLRRGSPSERVERVLGLLIESGFVYCLLWVSYLPPFPTVSTVQSSTTECPMRCRCFTC